MIKPWHFLPVVAAGALAASGYWWLAEKDRWTPPPPRKPDLPKVEPLEQHARVLARQAIERPVLWSSRRPIVVEEKKTRTTNELMQARLTAVLESGRESVAILQRADGSILKVTAQSSPWRIESFDGRRATFVSADNERVDRPLESGAADRARSPAARP
ncbi:hypothetical protein [Acidovorax sp.]|uniref:hypothetical protein n=1 Tax=Acidovorax sp. TaxID=1872122 RepID=UPI00391FA6B3